MRTRTGIICLGITVIFLALSAHGAPRTSADYSIPNDSTDAAGVHAQSANYSVNGSAVGEFGAGANALVASAAYIGKGGFVGELYEVISLSITASPSNNLSETASRQLNAAPQADDSTTLAGFNPSSVAWSIISGPIASISSSGLATAGNTYQDTPATVGGTAQSLSGQLNLMILNVTNDDFGTYAGDQIDDSWQVQYFGQPPNANASPSADPDGDGQVNLFEFTAGLVPTDSTSRFVLKIQSVGGQPSQKNLIFNPIAGGRTYTVQFTTTLISPLSWAPLTGTTEGDIGTERTVNDPNATGAKRFYRVEISKP
jgi:hypothetical protein